MAKRILKFSSLVLSLVVLALAAFWIIKPSPISLGNPEVQAIESVIAMSHEIESILICDPQSDINLLREVYVDRNEYELNKLNEIYNRLYVEPFLSGISSEGYLTHMTRYILWDRSIHSSTTLPENQKHQHSCQYPYAEYKIQISSVAIRDNLAVVVYNAPPYNSEAVLIKIKNKWFIAGIRLLNVNI